MSSKQEIKNEDSGRVQDQKQAPSKDREERMEEAGSSSQSKKLQLTSHKNLRKNESASKASEDQEMNDVEKKSNASASGEGEEEDEDSDEYDDEDNESHASFIAPDEEVEQEIYEAYEDEGQEERKKKKKKKRSFKLEEDDYDLIKDNTGFEVKKKKRLLRHAEREKDEDTEEMKADVQPVKREISDYLDEQEEDRETVRTERRREPEVGLSYEKKRMPPVDQRALQSLDSERVQVAKNIFEDTSVLMQEIADRQKEMARETLETEEQKGDIEEFFDGEEIDDQFATKQDKQIADTDIPERLQVKLGQRLAPTDEELQQEADWVFERLLEDPKKRDLIINGAIAKKKIFKVLRMFRTEFYDIPMITKYRKFEYTKDLEEEDVWIIFNLDLEYGKFNQQKQQIHNFIRKLKQFNQQLSIYEEELYYVQNQSRLNDFIALAGFLKSYYYQELQTLPEEQKKKMPVRQDQVQHARQYRLDEFARRCMLKPEAFVENLQNISLVHTPPEYVDVQPVIAAQQYLSDYYNEEIKIFTAVCNFAAQELAVQPYIRKILKDKFYNSGYVTTQPSEQGKKDIDVFHPSYRVKRINQQLIQTFFNDDLFLDIIQNEKNGLITVKIDLDPASQQQFYTFLESLYTTPDQECQWNRLRQEVLRKLVQSLLIPDIVKEIRVQLREAAENSVIRQSKDKYKQLLFTGPFSREMTENNRQSSYEDRAGSRGKPGQEEVIKDRTRLNVMGVVLQQLDNYNQVVTVAVVDKYGELVAHKDFLRLTPPRKPRAPQRRDDEMEDRARMMKLTQSEEEKEHEKDKDRIQELMVKHSVDLIVVGANKLEARRIKQTLQNIATNLKSYGPSYETRDEEEFSRSKRRGDYVEDERKEAFVIWGSLEHAKLFASSHQSTKLLKNCSPVLKQVVSLARYEQDPMQEVLNLWSSTPSENQTLQLNLHPLQKMLNQSKLADSLEEVNVKCVNNVGVDLNLLVDHDHMHSTLQFVSGLGPRKARRLIQKIKSTGKKIQTRGELYSRGYLEKTCYGSALAFLKIKCSAEELGGDQHYDLLDQTRIHLESYLLALKVACDVLYNQQEVEDKYQQYRAVKEVIMNPRKLRDLDIKQYSDELEKTGKSNMLPILDIIISEFERPFADPREYRSPNKQTITNHQLFYMLIDESERTFKRGIIVTATVVKVLDKIVLCKLDNGLDAVIHRDNLLGNTDVKLIEAMKVGFVMSGRIDEINYEKEERFQVSLKCKTKDLESHADFIDPSLRNFIPDEDMKNYNLQIEQKSQVQSRYQSRRINHPKFKNISSTKALLELQDKEVGDFVFRPSSKGQDNITLTWKFFVNNIVHMDIQEAEKPIGASIGSKLIISDEVFENLQEIVERYIIPCNRQLREVINHSKFIQCASQEELEQSLKLEKAEDQTRIPYKFTILEKYPQHVVMGYIPRRELVKEYIKIKPRGYYFHDKYHSPFQSVINWFKENFRTRDYQKTLRRQKSPRVRTGAVDVSAVNSGRPKMPPSSTEWEQVPKEWGKSAPGSVHSMNDEYQGEVSQTPMVKTEYAGIQASEHGGSTLMANTGNLGAFSDYNQINTNQMSSRRDYQDESRGRGDRDRANVYYNCNETGHMSREGPSKDRRSQYRGSRPRDDERDSRRKPEGGGWDSTTHIAKSPAANWNDTGFKTETVPKSPGGWGASEQQVVSQPPQASAAAWGQDNQQIGWGSNSPQRPDVQPTWGDSTMIEDARRGSPARSQRSYEDNRGRGRGRGRGSGGSLIECYKCHQEGHMARECPNEGDPSRSRGGPRTCYKCNQEGHIARDCPNEDASSRAGDRGRGRGRGRGGRDNSGGGNSCFKCGEGGHFARECPNESNNPDRRDYREGQPYKRQRREDGGSVRRENDDSNWNQMGTASGWNANEGGAEISNEGNGAWGASAGGGDWGQSDAHDQPAGFPQKSSTQEEGGWNFKPDTNADQ